ncbi:replicase associated protein [Yam spherical virus]|nr:replicase associated protein [Yam spherical virus]AQR60108.1 replicase associated protein [Yam spherical virus]
MANMILNYLVTVICSPLYAAMACYHFICRVVDAVLLEVKYLYGDFKAGMSYLLKKLTVSWIVVMCMILVLSFIIVGPLPSLTLYIIMLLCVGSKYGGRVPRYVAAHYERIKDAWEKGVDDDDCTQGVATECMERIPVKLRPRLACKIAVRAVAKVGLLKRSEANSLVYQRVCLDVMEAMKMRWHDRLVVLPQAVLACLERPQEVEEVMKAIEASCKGRFDEY